MVRRRRGAFQRCRSTWAGGGLSSVSVEEEAVPWTSTRHYSGVSTQQLKAARRETPGKPPCAHFAAGTCTRGNRCRFAHVGEGRQHSPRRAGQQFRTRKEEEAALLRARDALAPNIVLAPLVEAPLCSGHGELCNRFKVDKWGAYRPGGREYFRCARTGAEYERMDAVLCRQVWYGAPPQQYGAPAPHYAPSQWAARSLQQQQQQYQQPEYQRHYHHRLQHVHHTHQSAGYQQHHAQPFRAAAPSLVAPPAPSQHATREPLSVESVTVVAAAAPHSRDPRKKNKRKRTSAAAPPHQRRTGGSELARLSLCDLPMWLTAPGAAEAATARNVASAAAAAAAAAAVCTSAGGVATVIAHDAAADKHAEDFLCSLSLGRQQKKKRKQKQKKMLTQKEKFVDGGEAENPFRQKKKKRKQKQKKMLKQKEKFADRWGGKQKKKQKKMQKQKKKQQTQKQKQKQVPKQKQKMWPQRTVNSPRGMNLLAAFDARLAELRSSRSTARTPAFTPLPLAGAGRGLSATLPAWKTRK